MNEGEEKQVLAGFLSDLSRGDYDNLPRSEKNFLVFRALIGGHFSEALISDLSDKESGVGEALLVYEKTHPNSLLIRPEGESGKLVYTLVRKSDPRGAVESTGDAQGDRQAVLELLQKIKGPEISVSVDEKGSAIVQFEGEIHDRPQVKSGLINQIVFKPASETKVNQGTIEYDLIA